MIKTLNKYRHLFFDLDHTLWDFKTNSEQAMKLCLTHLQVIDKLPSFDAFFSFYEQVNERLWEEYRQGITNKVELSERRFAEPFAHFNIQGVDAVQANALYIEFMGEQKKLFPGCVELLRELQTKGFEMHIISNGFIEVQTKKLESAGIQSYFKSITLSEMVGAQKPKPAIFEYALKNSNARKTESIMIGDDWRNDILGALSFGIDAILFQDKEPNYLEIERVNANGAYANLELMQARKQACFYVNKLLDIPQILRY